MRSPFPRLARVAPLALGAVVSSAAVSLAETQDEIVTQMQAEGYKSIEVSTTWLRRVRIVGEGMPGSREVVIDPRNGEVLRDFSNPTPPEGMPPPGRPGRPGPRGPRPGGPGGADRDPPPGGFGGHDHPEGPGGPGGPGGGPGGPGGGPGGPGGGPGHSAPDGN